MMRFSNRDEMDERDGCRLKTNFQGVGLPRLSNCPFYSDFIPFIPVKSDFVLLAGWTLGATRLRFHVSGSRFQGLVRNHSPFVFIPLAPRPRVSESPCQTVPPLDSDH